MAGLQDISPRVSKAWVSSRVRAPKRAEAAAASQPAWPPPMTTTSYFIGGSIRAAKSIYKWPLLNSAHRQGAAEVAELHTVGARAAAFDRHHIARRGARQMPDRFARDLPPDLAIVERGNQISGPDVIIDQPGSDFIDRVRVHGIGIGMGTAIGDAFTAELGHRGLGWTIGATGAEQAGDEAAAALAMYRRRRGRRTRKRRWRVERAGHAHHRGIVARQPLRLVTRAQTTQHRRQRVVARIGLSRRCRQDQS